jgi:hypothetical protein
MKRKRYFALGLVLVGAAAIGLAGWGYAGSANAHPGNTCNPGAGHGLPGCHVDPTPVTDAPTTTTAAPTPATDAPTTTTDAPTTTTTSTASTTTTTSATSTTGSTTSTTAAPEGSSFSDVLPSYAYYTQIGDLAARQVISGYSDGTFKPDLPVTRQLFAKMIVKALGFTVTGSEQCPFTDVVSGQDEDPFFPDKYVAVCAARGITEGKTASTFAPYDNITRQQLVTMVVRAAHLADPAGGFTPPFVPGQFFPEEHYLNARMAAFAGLFRGLSTAGSGYFLAPATRGEVAVMLYNLLHR